jgi:hypothetical protein
MATAPFHTGEVGVAYAPVALSATGGVQPYTWSVVAGALPAGLSIGSDGTVSGSPTNAGNFSFTIQAADSGNSMATVTGSVGIAAALSATLRSDCATQCSVELGCNVCGAFGEQSGGSGPYSYALTSGQLPAGTSLSGVGLSLTGTFVGSSGYLFFTVQVTDSLGATASVTPKFMLYDHISLAGGVIGGSPANACYWTGCSRQFSYSGGIGTASVAITGWTYSETCSGFPAPPKPCPEPARPSVSANGGSVNIAIPSPGGTWINGYTATLTLLITDQALCASGSYCSASATYTITVYGG